MSIDAVLCLALAWTTLGSVLFLATGGLARHLRHPALRRLAWLSAFACVAGLPLLALNNPARQSPFVTGGASDPICIPDEASAGLQTRITAVALGGWAIGSAAVLGWTLLALARVSRWGRGGVVFETASPAYNQFRNLAVQVASGSAPVAPMIAGFFRPVVLLPRTAEFWDDSRIRAVLWHELGHVTRGDHLVQLLALAVCALHWFNPLFWMARRRLEAEAEMAADSFAIEHGVRPSSYASALLSVASDFGSNPMSVPRSHAAMVKSYPLEERIRCILEPSHAAPFAPAPGQKLIVGMLAACCAALLISTPPLTSWCLSQVQPSPPGCVTAAP